MKKAGEAMMVDETKVRLILKMTGSHTLEEAVSKLVSWGELWGQWRARRP